jgi:hypothetical protein
MRYKGIIYDNKDHPLGLGTLIIADNCTHDCKCCINRGIITKPSFSHDYRSILTNIFKKTINKYIILGGLEWTEQIEDVYNILELCTDLKSPPILYTHWPEEEFAKKFPKLFQYHGFYIKFGEYLEKFKSNKYFSHGIPLASTNQYIKYFQ